MPWRMAAASRGSPALAVKLRPLGSTLTLKLIFGILGGSVLLLDRAGLPATPNFAFKPESPRRAARAFSPPARAHHRLRRCRPARGPPAAAPAQGHRADLVRRAACRPCAGSASRRCWAIWTMRPRCAGWPDWRRAWCIWRRRPATTRTGAMTRARWRCCALCACAACRSRWCMARPAACMAIAAASGSMKPGA